MKKMLVLVLSFGLIIGLVQMSSASQYITVLVNNQKVTFPDQKPYIDQNNRTMVPVRFVSEALGAKVSWNGKTQTVGIIQGGKDILLKIGESKASVNGQLALFDTKAVLINSRTMVPLRFVSETLGAQVDWVAATSTVKITVNNHGYSLPKGKSDLSIDVPTDNDNSAKVDIDLGVMMYKPLEPQYTDLENILASKFGTKLAQEITDYVKTKNDRFDNLPEKNWTVNNQIIEVASQSGSISVGILIWLPGVK